MKLPPFCQGKADNIVIKKSLSIVSLEETIFNQYYNVNVKKCQQRAGKLCGIWENKNRMKRQGCCNSETKGTEYRCSEKVKKLSTKMSTVEREEKYFIIERYSVKERSNVINGRNLSCCMAREQ